MWIQVVLIISEIPCRGFQDTRKLKEGELFLTLVDGSRIPVIAVGVYNVLSLEF